VTARARHVEVLNIRFHPKRSFPRIDSPRERLGVQVCGGNATAVDFGRRGGRSISFPHQPGETAHETRPRAGRLHQEREIGTREHQALVEGL
jgi:hypothetical protein